MERLTTTLKLLDEAKINCRQLEDKLRNQEIYYLQREKDLQESHRCDLEREKASLVEFKNFMGEQFVECYTKLQEEGRKILQKNQELCAAEKREKELKELFSAHLIDDNETIKKYLRQRDMVEKQVRSQLFSYENKERELCEKLNLAKKEISVLRSSQRSFNGRLDRDSSNSSPHNSSTLELARFESEVDRLHCVLESQQKEISKLIKENEKLTRDAKLETSREAPSIKCVPISRLGDWLPKWTSRAQSLGTDSKSENGT